MSAVGSYLFGSNPKVDYSSQSTLSPYQQYLLPGLDNTLIAGNQPGSINNPTYQGQLTAGLTPQQQSTINSFTNQGNAAGVLGNLGNYGLADAIGTTAGVANSTPADFSSYFQNSVVQPNEQVFNQQTIPSLQQAFGASEGGVNGSAYTQAVDTAAQNLGNTLAGDASSTALTQYNDQQQNTLTAGQNLASDYSLPTNTLGSVLNAQGQVQSTNQATDTNAYNAFQNQLTQGNTTLADIINYLGNGQIQNNQIVKSGTQGAIQGATNALAGAVGSKL